MGRSASCAAPTIPRRAAANAPDGRKVKGTIHWVSEAHALPAEVRLYAPLFDQEDPGSIASAEDLASVTNPESLQTLTGCRVEPSLADAAPGARYQFERQGYFCLDPDTEPGKLVFNRTVGLKDAWARSQAKPAASDGDKPTKPRRRRRGR